MESREKKKTYYWTVRGERVEVTEEVYLGILSENERVRRLARNEQRCARTDSLYCLGDCSECRYRMAGMLRELSDKCLHVIPSEDIEDSVEEQVIRRMTVEHVYEQADILKLVTVLISNTKGEGKGGDDFWVKAETLLYIALIGYIHYELPPEEQNFATLIDMLNIMDAREDDEDYQNEVDLKFADLGKRKPGHFAVRQYAKYKMAAGKTAKSINYMSICQAIAGIASRTCCGNVG